MTKFHTRLVFLVCAPVDEAQKAVSDYYFISVITIIITTIVRSIGPKIRLLTLPTYERNYERKWQTITRQQHLVFYLLDNESD